MHRSAADTPPADGPAGTQFELKLERTTDAPGTARTAVVRWLAGTLGDDERDSAKLLTSELVTNAVVHGSGEITLRARIDDDRVLVEVIDQGDGFERAVREHDFDSLGGRGLAIVDSEASRWGIHQGTTHVWFELERPGPRLGSDKKPGG